MVARRTCVSCLVIASLGVLVIKYCPENQLCVQHITIHLKLEQIDIDKHTQVEVRCKIESLSFSAHADSKGIMQLIQQTQPANVMLVHGEPQKMYEQ